MKVGVINRGTMPKQVKARNLRKEGFEKGYRGNDLELYSKGFPVPVRKK